MTRSSKIALVGGGFIFCIALGYAFPGVWFWYLLLLLFILVRPTTGTHEAVTGIISQAPNNSDLQQLENAIEEKIESTADGDIKIGMMEILSIVRGYRQQRAAQVIGQLSAPATSSFAISDASPVPLMSDAERLQADDKREQQNINTMLYVASFLLVGAAVLFIGTALNPMAKFIGLVLVTLAFYVTGIMLYSRVSKLRPAAIAFTGTGLALVPFVGLAFYNYVVQDGSLAWWMTSIAGLAMFLYATLLIKHQVLSYISIAFIFSLTIASASMLDTAFVWYFVVVIVTGSAMAYVGYLRPSWLPGELAKPLSDNGQIAAPVAVIGSLFVSDRFQPIDYELIFGVATLHYSVAALGLDKREKYLYWTLARIFAIAMALTATYDITRDWRAVTWTLAVSAVLSHLYAISRRDNLYEKGWLVYAQVALVYSVATWAPDWTNVSLGLVVVILMSAWQTAHMKSVGHGLAGIGALLILPPVTVFGVMNVDHEFELTAIIMTLMTWLFFTGRYIYRRSHPAFVQLLSIGYVTFIFGAVISTVSTHSSVWIASILMIAAVLFYLAAFIEESAVLHVVSNSALAVSVWYFFRDTQLSSEWWPLATAWVCALIWYGLRWYFARSGDIVRRDIMATSTLIVLLLGALVSAQGLTVIAACLTGCLTAGIIAYEGFTRREVAYYELAIGIATLSLQRLIGEAYPLTNTLVYTHWWAMSIAAMAAVRLQSGDRPAARTRGYVALGFLSLPTGMYALGDPDSYQFLFLLEHLAILVGGFVTSKKSLVQWGAAGVILALVWLLKGYTYVLLTLLALGLIGLAIWRLMKNNTRPQ